MSGVKKWLLRIYLAKQGSRAVSRDSGVSERVLAGYSKPSGKIGAGSLKRLLAWQERKRFSYMSQEGYLGRVENLPVRPRYPSAELAGIKARIRRAEFAKPSYKKVKKYMLRRAAAEKGVDVAAREMGVKSGVLQQLIKKSFMEFMPSKKAIASITEWQKKAYATRKQQAARSGREKGRAMAKYRVLLDRNVSFTTTGVPYVNMVVPVNSAWLSGDDSDKMYDRYADIAYSRLMSGANRRYLQFAGSFYGKINFMTRDERSKEEFSVYYTVPETPVSDYNAARKEIFGAMRLLFDDVFIFLQSKERYQFAKIDHVTITVKFREAYNAWAQ